MFFPRSPCSLLLPTFFIFFLSLSVGNSQNLPFQISHIPGTETADESANGVVSVGMRRSVLEANNSLILAAERTRRKDPSRDFKYYTGGWNISDKHYFYSVAFTGAPLFLVAGIWLVGFGLSLLLSCLCCCCCPRPKYGYSQTCYALSLILLSLFTIAAIAGCTVLYTGQRKFHDGTSDTLDYIVEQSNTTVDNLRNVSSYLEAAKRVEVYQVFLPREVQNSIDKAEAGINTAATVLARETHTNEKKIENALESARIALIVVAAVMLLLALLGFLFSVLGLQFLVYILVGIGWILVAGTFVLGGVFLVLHNVVGDTCVAMDEWVQNPTAHTALDDILPCVDYATAQEALSESEDVTFQLVNTVNGVITNVSNGSPPPRVGPPLYYNQSGPPVPVLCNPFNPDKSDRNCEAGEVDFNNATRVWKNYLCEFSNSSKMCITEGRLTPDMYAQMTNVVTVIYGLKHYGPFLIGLLDCSIVRDTFGRIYADDCPDLRLYSKWVYAGLGLASASVMISLIFWIIYARERRHRRYTRLAKAASVEK
ncbi:hypothetical protein NMG60_11004846 [Bertholletia excelsa]